MRKFIILLALLTGCITPCECKKNEPNKPEKSERDQSKEKIEEHLINPDLPYK